MQYLLMICHDRTFAPSEALIRDIGAWVNDMEARNVRVHGNPLRPPRDAMTVRVREGQLRVTHGPFAHSREKMCAYELIECATREEAVGLASQHPMAKVATIEVRPVWAELAEQ
jgi:hypothetical protein